MEIYSILDVQPFTFWEHINTDFYNHNLKAFYLLFWSTCSLFSSIILHLRIINTPFNTCDIVVVLTVI